MRWVWCVIKSPACVVKLGPYTIPSFPLTSVRFPYPHPQKRFDVEISSLIMQAASVHPVTPVRSSFHPTLLGTQLPVPLSDAASHGAEILSRICTNKIFILQDLSLTEEFCLPRTCHLGIRCLPSCSPKEKVTVFTLTGNWQFPFPSPPPPLWLQGRVRYLRTPTHAPVSN